MKDVKGLPHLKKSIKSHRAPEIKTDLPIPSPSRAHVNLRNLIKKYQKDGEDDDPKRVINPRFTDKSPEKNPRSFKVGLINPSSY